MVLAGVPSVAYLWVPIGIGGGVALVFLLAVGFTTIPYLDQGVVQRVALFDRRYWKARFYATAAWTFGDSGATNITALGTAVVAVLSNSVLQTIFPAIDLSPFILMNIACGGLVAVAPILFAIINFFVARQGPIVPADASLTLRADATVTLLAGASIAVPGGAEVRPAGGAPVRAAVKAGGTLPVPPGTVLTVHAAAIMAVPSGSVLALAPGTVLSADSPIASGDIQPRPAHPVAEGGQGHGLLDWLLHSAQLAGQPALPPAPGQPAPAPGGVPRIERGELITLTEGAAATVNGTADVLLREETTVIAPGRRAMTLRADTTLTVPCGSHVMTAGMASVLPAAVLTVFAAATEIGLVTVLAAHYARTGAAAHAAAVVIAAVVAAGLVIYGVTALRSLAEPTSGSSLNSGGGTSFTL